MSEQNLADKLEAEVDSEIAETAPKSATDNTQEPARKAALQLEFRDFAVEPIPGINYKITTADGRSIGSGSSDGEGKTALHASLEPETTIKVWVKRDADGQYKCIGTTQLGEGANNLTCVSPKIKLEGETQPAEGAPGKAHETQPPVPEKIEAIRTADGASTAATAKPAETTSTYTVTAGDYPGKIAQKCGMTTAQFMALNPQIKDVTKMNVGDVVNVRGNSAASAVSTPQSTAPITKGKAASATITQGRDADGLPMAIYVKEGKDWVGRQIQSAYNFWTSADFLSGGGNTSGHNNINPLIKADSMSPEALKLLNTLVDFTEKQATLKYPKSTAAVLAEYHSGKTDWPTKQFDDLGDRICLVYVKVALKMCGYTNGVTNTIPAKDTGPDWVHFGFSDVTGTLPTVDIKMKNEEVIKQADLVYTLPGDVIVYEQYGDERKFGHIDIRTYHSFGSEFLWTGRNGFPDQSKYKVRGVYRKFSDTLAAARVQAFLRILREQETRGYAEKDRYHALHDTSGKTKPTFTDESEHPSQAPAGAYQFANGTFNSSTVMMGWPKFFTPDMQDRMAIYLLQYRREKQDYPPRTALGYIMKGEIEKAISDTDLRSEWTALPGAKEPALTMDQLKSLFQQYTNQYAAAKK